MSEPRLILADCLDALRELDAASVDAVCTDPPYGMGFMGQAWDGKAIEEAAQRERASARDLPPRLTGNADAPNRKLTVRTGSAFANRAGEAGAYDFTLKGNRAFQAWVEQWGAELLRVLKPGGHALVFGGTRTYHRLAAGLEDAGFEIRDCLAWLFGSGFPKSHDVAKAIDEKVGAEGTWLQQDHPGRSGGRTRAESEGVCIGQTFHASDDNPDGLRHLYEAASDDARAWDGWGTALKPAFEPIVVARKPLSGTVAETVLRYGTGAINVKGCAIPFRDADDEAEAKEKNRHADFGSGARENQVYGADDRTRAEQGNYDPGGRWPANVAVDEEAAEILDQQTGALAPGNRPGERLDGGGASRFFYCAKVSRLERNAGLAAFEDVITDVHARHHSRRMEEIKRADGAAPAVGKNHHPTVKPIALMRWLIKLVTPPGGRILDPFLGSGSTGCAAMLEGVEFIGIEREAEYMAIAEARIAFWQEHGDAALDYADAERQRVERRDEGQLDLFMPA